MYQVEFYSFMVRYPTAGASVYCGHIFSVTTLSICLSVNILNPAEGFILKTLLRSSPHQDNEQNS